MTLEALKEEITQISEFERKHLRWSCGFLLAEVKDDIATSRTQPLSEVIFEMKAALSARRSATE